MATIERFEDMAVWQDSRHLVREVYAITGHGALSRDFEMRDQLRRAALSTMTNSAEGFERGTNPDFVRFLNIVRGSAGEIRSLLYAALDQGFIEETTFNRLKEQTELVSRRSAKLVQYLTSTSAAGCWATRNRPLAAQPRSGST